MAFAGDAEVLTEIAFKAKKHWGYPESYFDVWKDELTISSGYISKNIVYCAEWDEKIIGFYSIVFNPENFLTGEIFVEQGYWLEHIFIRPDFHRQGIGRKLINHAKKIAKSKNIEKLYVFVDPFAKGFYDKIKANFSRNSASSIKGRNIPVYELAIE